MSGLFSMRAKPSPSTRCAATLTTVKTTVLEVAFQKVASPRTVR
jgi:hypothetical protein